MQPAEMPAQFYRYTDSAGVEHLVEGLGSVPKGLRQTAKPLSVTIETSKTPLNWPKLAMPKSSPSGLGLHAPSLLAGLVLGVVLAQLARKLPFARVGLLKRVVLGVLVLGGAALYLGVVRQQALGTGSVMASPKDMIDDAHKAKEALQKHLQTQDKALRQIEGMQGFPP